MPHRQPRIWLLTDERMGDGLWHALGRVPPGGGVVFRHHSLSSTARAKLFVRVRRVARARRLVILGAGRAFAGADGAHNMGGGRGVRTGSAHDRREARAKVRRGATLLFVSPVFATRSHPGAPALGVRRAAAVARAGGVPAIALGGMDARAARLVARHGFSGWAAIDAWLG